MPEGIERFYITGGTMPHDASSYITRHADAELYESLLRGEFCYVLNTRQMGKSSLMVRTATKLRQAGVQVGILDLTAIGQNVTPEQWYDGLLTLLAERLRLRDAVEDFWLDHDRLGPMQRWIAALQHVLLPRLAAQYAENADSRLVIFVDEIDAVRSLPFSTDEFFAGIRECYNRRTEDPAFARFTFCLLGVATPSDLIVDTRISPFNIGRRIVLTDFTPEEAAPLEPNPPLGGLDRVLYWTGGHPYMTQRLCRAIAESLSDPTASSVDAHCARLFLNKAAREADDNLAFVHNRLLKGECDLVALLELYGKVWRGKSVKDDETNPLCSLLRLSGVCKVVDGELKVRNRIYARVFDRAWIRENMPGAELHRQQIAFRRGVLRTSLVAGMIIAVIGTLAFLAVGNAHRAVKAEAGARAEATRAYRLLYASNTNLAQQKIEGGDIAAARQLLDEILPKRGQPDLRNFEWYYLDTQCRQARITLKAGDHMVAHVAFAPDGTLYANEDDHIAAFDTEQGRRLRTFPFGGPFALAPKGDVLACVAASEGITLVDTRTAERRRTLRLPEGQVTALAFSPDGARLAVATAAKAVYVFRIATGERLLTLSGHRDKVYTVAFSPDGSMLATGGQDHRAILWSAQTGVRLHTLEKHTWYVYTLAFTPDGKTLATAGGDGDILLWNVADGSLKDMLKGHESYVYGLAMSPDGRTLASVGWDGAERLWDLRTNEPLRTLRGLEEYIWSVAFSPDGRRLAAGDHRGNIKIWNTTEEIGAHRLTAQRTETRGIAFTADSRKLYSASLDGSVACWDANTGARLDFWQGSRNTDWMTLDPVGARLLTVAQMTQLDLWETRTHRNVSHLTSPAGYLFAPPSNRAPAYVSANLERVMAFTLKGDFKALQVANGAEICAFHTNPGEFNAILSAEGSRFVLASIEPGNAGRIQVWNTDTGTLEREWKGHDQPILCLKPLGSTGRFATLDAGGTWKIWDMDGEMRDTASVPDLRQNLDTVMLSEDGKRLVRRVQHNTIGVVDIETGRELLRLKGGKEALFSVYLSPDGMHIATGSFESPIYLWNAPR